MAHYNHTAMHQSSLEPLSMVRETHQGPPYPHQLIQQSHGRTLFNQVNVRGDVLPNDSFFNENSSPSTGRPPFPTSAFQDHHAHTVEFKIRFVLEHLLVLKPDSSLHQLILDTDLKENFFLLLDTYEADDFPKIPLVASPPLNPDGSAREPGKFILIDVIRIKKLQRYKDYNRTGSFNEFDWLCVNPQHFRQFGLQYPLRHLNVDLPVLEQVKRRRFSRIDYFNLGINRDINKFQALVNCSNWDSFKLSLVATARAQGV